MRWLNGARFRMRVLDMALVVLTPDRRAARSRGCLQLGVQDVLPTREATRRIALALPRRSSASGWRPAARRAYATDLGTVCQTTRS